MINSVHNIHFEQEPVPLIIAPEVEGQPLVQFNPGVAFRTIETGTSYQGGDANSGAPLAPEDVVFSLVMDIEPGVYSYFCDVHPGMVGLVTVVPDDTAIPSPSEATLQGSIEFGSTIQAARAAALELEAQPAEAGMVQVGSGDTGRASVNQYFPFVTEITAGDSVTFGIPETSVEVHTISWPPARDQDVSPIPMEGGPPVLLLGPGTAPLTQSGASVGVGDAFSSGLFEPGQSFTLTFAEPGIYPFVCNIHPGMNGVIVVEADA
jgi:plastocyanin